MKKILFLLSLIGVIVFADDVELCANLDESPVISRVELGFIYKGKIKHWFSGGRIIIVIRPKNSRTQDKLIKDILRISTTTFHEYIARNSNIRVIENSAIVREMKRRVGSLGLIDNMVIIGTHNGFVLVEILEGS